MGTREAILALNRAASSLNRWRLKTGDRAYRIGQKNPVFVHKLICQGTVEERIHQMQQKKSELADALLSDNAQAAAPDHQTLSALLAPLG